ncbi:MAG TPA: hypothetical protein EYQ50_29565 [Verrucomicrobiales bacterium]|nr:hypothetical protein [Verrucomicrobiales bacterium]HIK97837.1 hypothetical protein [Gammaproteobacteria bacterium]
MELEKRHVVAFAQAENLICHCDYCPYLELKEMIQDESGEARVKFRSLFSRYYGMDPFVKPDFKDKFFEILFSRTGIDGNGADYSKILHLLVEGGHGFQASFVSKLVNIHVESSPIDDVHVRDLLGEKLPYTYINIDNKIDWFERHLREIKSTYEEWGKDKRIFTILERFKSKDKGLQSCHIVRLMDFLVWKVGNQNLLGR